MTEERDIHVQAETYDPLEPLDNGEPGLRLAGLRDVQGTFSGTLLDSIKVLEGYDKGPMQLYLYGPDPDLPRWKHWFYRIRERLTGDPYPTVCLASGPALMAFEEEHEDGDDIVMTGTFTKAGTWTFHDKEVNP